MKQKDMGVWILSDVQKCSEILMFLLLDLVFELEEEK